jgi:hypothetical protein
VGFRPIFSPTPQVRRARPHGGLGLGAQVKAVFHLRRHASCASNNLVPIGMVIMVVVGFGHVAPGAVVIHAMAMFSF